jgi:peptidoglycan hydrolase CwlO-like protein
MVHVSQQYLDATINSLLQSVADMASKAAQRSGELADANMTIAQLRARIAELEKTPAKE